VGAELPGRVRRPQPDHRSRRDRSTPTTRDLRSEVRLNAVRRRITGLRVRGVADEGVSPGFSWGSGG
jgi:hypothetical protein